MMATVSEQHNHDPFKPVPGNPAALPATRKRRCRLETTSEECRNRRYGLPNPGFVQIQAENLSQKP